MNNANYNFVVSECTFLRYFMPIINELVNNDIGHNINIFLGDSKKYNSPLLKDNLDFIKESSNIFGSQCIVCSIDVKFVDNEYKVFNKAKGILDIDPLELALKYEKYGAGEILLTAIDHEGSTKGYDIELIKKFNHKLGIPVILNGGMGKPEDAVEAINNGADAVAAAYIFHFSQYTPDDIKNELASNNIAVRL